MVLRSTCARDVSRLSASRIANFILTPLSASKKSLRASSRREQTSLSKVSHSRDLGSSPHWMAIFFASGSFFSGSFATSMVSVPLSNAARSLEKSVFSGMRNARC